MHIGYLALKPRLPLQEINKLRLGLVWCSSSAPNVSTENRPSELHPKPSYFSPLREYPTKETLSDWLSVCFSNQEMSNIR